MDISNLGTGGKKAFLKGVNLNRQTEGSLASLVIKTEASLSCRAKKPAFPRLKLIVELQTQHEAHEQTLVSCPLAT